MVSRPVRLALGLSVLLLLSGCSGGKPKDDGHDDHAADDGEDVAVGNVTAVISVLVNGTALQPLNGTIVVVAGVNVTFDASRSTGGSNMTFEWDLAGTEATGARVVHQFTSVGPATVKLTVVARSAFAEAALLLNVTSGGPPAGTVLHTQREAFSGSLTAGNPNSPSQAGVDYADHAVTIAATTPNGTGLAQVVRIALDASGAAAVQTTVYWRAGGANVASSLSDVGSPDTTLEYTGDMLAGEYVVRVRLNAGLLTDYDVTVEIDYMAA